MIGVGSTLGRYFALRFVQSIGLVFVAVFSLVYLIDLVELVRRAGDTRAVSTAVLARLALFRVPTVTEQVLPFAVLFGSLWAFLSLSRRLELVIARAAGISAWQFIFPALAVAVGMGVFAVTVYNPVAAHLKSVADNQEARLFTRAGGNERSPWLRQRSVDGEAVIRADAAEQEGTVLRGVEVFVFDRAGIFVERVDAEVAELMRGNWRLTNARIITPGIEPQVAAQYLMPTNLDAEQVRQALGSSEVVSFWHLPATITRLELAGLDATRYRLRLNSLLARPLFLAAMVLVAASVSLRFFRFGGVARMVLSGVVAGFALYVGTQIAEDLGAAGLFSAAFAAWTPAVIGALMGVLVLLHEEDA
jgi:lipopolysaccharide export system permease protein